MFRRKVSSPLLISTSSPQATSPGEPGAQSSCSGLKHTSADGAVLVGPSPPSLVGASPVGASPVGVSPVGASLVGASLVGASLVGASPVGSSAVGSSAVGSSGDFSALCVPNPSGSAGPRHGMSPHVCPSAPGAHAPCRLLQGSAYAVEPGSPPSCTLPRGGGKTSLRRAEFILQTEDGSLLTALGSPTPGGNWTRRTVQRDAPWDADRLCGPGAAQRESAGWDCSTRSRRPLTPAASRWS